MVVNRRHLEVNRRLLEVNRRQITTPWSWRRLRDVFAARHLERYNAKGKFLFTLNWVNSIDKVES